MLKADKLSTSKAQILNQPFVGEITELILCIQTVEKLGIPSEINSLLTPFSLHFM